MTINGFFTAVSSDLAVLLHGSCFFMTPAAEHSISDIPLAADIIHCIGMLALIAIPCIVAVLPLRLFTKIPSFIFRKVLHIIAFTGVSLMILFAHNWQSAALTSLILAALLYPLLAAIENRPWFPHLFVEKKPGEIKSSFLMLTFMFSAVIIFCWGIFRQPHLAAAAILMWGTGDAAAALIGIPFGKHKVKCPLADGKKSWEGSAAMFAVSLISGMIVLVLVQKSLIVKALLLSCLGALAGTAAELISPSELDTVTVPVTIAAVLIFLNLLI